MNDFNRCNKVLGVHWLKRPIEDLQLKVQLKPQDGIISLPKFSDYTNETTSNILDTNPNNTEEYTFNWQEKVFSAWEVQRYTNPHNCISDIELNYHDQISQNGIQPSRIFTYIHDDNYAPLPYNQDRNKSENNSLSLNTCFERLNINGRLERYMKEDTVSMGHLFKSEENVCDDHWMAMHIVFDNSDYTSDTQLLLKQEAILVSLYYNTNHKFLIMAPDVNDMEWNPYLVETASGARWNYQYSLTMEFEDEGSGGEELVTLLQKLRKRLEKKSKRLLSFIAPPIGKKQYHLTLEIVSAAEFEMDDMYIEFDIKLPEGMECSDDLHGRTHTAHSLRTVEGKRWHYAHVMEICLECEARCEPQPCQLFLEAISCGWWGRRRTEGYARLCLPPAPGRRSERLRCVRPQERHGPEAEARRFFVGGCHLIKDRDVLAKPMLQEANYSFVGTGTVTVRWSVLMQRRSPTLPSHAPPPCATSSTPAVLQGAEAALTQYRRAKERLAAATRGLEREDDDD